MKKYATLKDVAKRAGTSAATVSYVLNEKEGRYISDETRQKVLDAAKELDYVKSIGASSLKGKSRKLIAILIPQFENQFFTRIIVASERIFVKHGYDDAGKELVFELGSENTTLIRRVGMKMVVVDRPLDGVENFFWVSTNNYGCGYMGANHLFANGHKKIGYVGWRSGIKDLDARRQAILDAADEHRIDADQIHIAEGEFSQEAGYDLTARLLDEHPDITAIFYGFNVQALGGVRCLTERGIAIPTDLSVVIIGSPEWVSAGQNDFTYVDMNDLELGKKAANLLLAQIQDKDIPYQHIIQDCTLKAGSSVRNISQEEKQ